MIFIRADANEHIGTGHVMRCLSIAHAFERKGKKVAFITADHCADSLILNFPIICLDSIWCEMDLELQKIEELIITGNPELFLVDSYFVTDRYLKKVSSYVRTVYMDDMNASVWDVDFLINYNIYSEMFDYSNYKGRRTKLLIDTQYAPLREEFINLPKYCIKKVSNILVSAGGSDPEKVTEKIIDYICPRYPSILFHVLVGALNPRLDVIRQRKKKNTILHINESYIVELMQNCDIAISAAGTTLYELCAVGIPTITYTLADNQTIAADWFAQKGIMLNAGDQKKNDIFLSNLKEYLDLLIVNTEERRGFSQVMRRFVDGRGSDRIVQAISNFELT